MLVSQLFKNSYLTKNPHGWFQQNDSIQGSTNIKTLRKNFQSQLRDHSHLQFIRHEILCELVAQNGFTVVSRRIARLYAYTYNLITGNR